LFVENELQGMQLLETWFVYRVPVILFVGGK